MFKKIFMSKIFVIFCFLFYIFFAFPSNYLFSQCECCLSGQQFLPPLHWLGSSEVGISERKRLRIDFSYKFAYSDRLYTKDIYRTDLTKFKNHSFSLFASYGLDYNTMLDFTLSYSVRSLRQYGFESKGYGFSNVYFGLRRNFYETETSDFILNFGAGLSLPLMKFKEIEGHPIVIQPSNGSFGLYAMGFGQKSFKTLNLNLLLFTRLDYYFKNSLNFQFGPNFVTSLLVSKRFSNKFNAITELRSEVHFKDKYNDSTYQHSGSRVFNLIPRITYQGESFSLSPYFELPVYQFYEGEQIGNKFTFGLNFSYVFNFARRKIN